MGLEKAICTYNENLIELHLNDYDKFRHWNVWYKYVKKRKVREIHVAILLLSSDMKIVQMCMIYPQFD